MIEDATPSSAARPSLTTEELAGYEPEVGAALWRLQDARRRTLRVLKNLPQDLINKSVDGNSIGTILYHLALIEADWLYVEILQQAFPPEVKTWLPEEDRDEQGVLTAFGSETLEEHIVRLDLVRERVLKTLVGMTKEDLYRPRQLSDYDVSPAWVLHHLAQHEAEHRSELESVASRLGKQASDQ